MSPHKDLFVNYYPYSGGKVYLGDDYPLEIVGRGDINIKLDNDMERNLCDACYVPDPWKKFISIKMMYKSGYATTFNDS